MSNNKKYPKRTPEWEKEVQRIVGKEVEKEFKKGEVKPDGTTVSAETGEKIKVNDFKQLFTDIEKQKEKVKEKLIKLNGKDSQGSELANIYREYDELEKKLYTGTDGNGADS